MSNDDEKVIEQSSKNKEREEGVNQEEKLESIDIDEERVIGKEEESQLESEGVEKHTGFITWLISNLIDQGLCIILSFLIVILLGVILPAFGYRLSNRTLMVFLIYIISNILYSSILGNKTIGRRILNF